MKKKTTVIILSVVMLLITTQALYYKGYSNRAGAPIARTGSPFDNSGVACNASGCHTGFSITNVTGWITSNIPGTGYAPGSTYTVTATATFSALVRFGFEISPQRANGNIAGTIIITDATNTQLAAGNPKYITHTTTGTNAASTPGTKTWTFNWTAPATGTGTVTFYGAFNCANNSNTSVGDRIHLTTMVVSEDFTSSMSKPEDASFAFNVFPNPASDQITVSVQSELEIKYSAELVDINGRIVKQLMNDSLVSGTKQSFTFNISDIEAGIYFLLLKSKTGTAAKRIVIL
ncbi:MAG: T9SS type A sorting domain-containing protein [Bacteroidia bacterium]|nr:T9SS type A sorting domain-containing protein [Bacteroidia bacterium]